ncbi:MAG: glycoside hydrolase family 11 protein [Oscillospiraceae bacterium]|nr:glycoside hydrolase family 11 protein [Oscillospiraceae bacterium]
MKKRILSFTLVLMFTFALVLAVPASARDVSNITGNARSTYDGFDWEFWSERRNDGATMALTGGGTFTGVWENTLNILFRMGKRLGSTTTYEEYGDITIDYVATHNILRGGASYLCVYGWTQKPLVEFYIVESRGSYNPGSSGTSMGSITVDGGIYDVWVTKRVNKPSIEGNNTTFDQYWSIRRDNRTSGTISVHEHFKAWEELGMDMSGVLYEVMLCIEGYNTSGNGSVTSHVITIGDEVYGTKTDSTPAPTPTPDPTPEPAPSPSPSGFTTTDALNILKSTSGALTLTAEQTEKYDVNEDGKVDLSDALAILKLVVGG